MNAIEVVPEEFPRRRGLSGISYWIWLDDLKFEEPKQESEKNGSVINLQTSISHPHLNDKVPRFEIIEKREESPTSCCGCFGWSSKAKKQKKYQDQALVSAHAPPIVVTEPEKAACATPARGANYNNHNHRHNHPPSLTEPMDASDSGLENSEGEDNFGDELKLKADILHKKSTKFYQLLLDLEGNVRNKLLAYFEQRRSILVLDTIYEEGIIIVCISTKIDQLTALQEDFLNGQLVQDLEDAVVDDEVRRHMKVQSMKLQLSVDEEEFPKAIRDLEGC